MARPHLLVCSELEVLTGAPNHRSLAIMRLPVFSIQTVSPSLGLKEICNEEAYRVARHAVIRRRGACGNCAAHGKATEAAAGSTIHRRSSRDSKAPRSEVPEHYAHHQRSAIGLYVVRMGLVGQLSVHDLRQGRRKDIRNADGLPQQRDKGRLSFLEHAIAAP